MSSGTVNQDHGRAKESSRRAAAYVRMSTEHQQYSTENQLDTILAYAKHRNLNVVRTYTDEGKSGLNLDGRNGLKQLLGDIEARQINFTAILVYDVSRWGRFQDPDESASYEVRCRKAGVSVHYCAEQFENDGTPVSNIIKSVKRMMAGEYSRELSVKVFAGQSRLISKGFRQGGPAGYGLRRLLIDENGNAKYELASKQHKSIQTDRVVLVPGPLHETETVKYIYRRFIFDGLKEDSIAAELNARGVHSDRGRPWTRGTIHQILINEKYIGHNVWNRRSFKLKQQRVNNPPDRWVRFENAFAALVSKELFNAAQAIIAKRSERLSDAEMLEVLREILKKHGYLSGLIIDETEGCPSSSAYAARFGSLLRTYSLVGYEPLRNYQYIKINQHLRELHPQVITEIIAHIRDVGGNVTVGPESSLLVINNEYTVSLVISRCLVSKSGAKRWVIRFDFELCPDLTIAARLSDDNQSILDYYILPSIDMRADRIRLAEQNEAGLDIYRFDNLEPLLELSRRTPLDELVA